tara:strand:+ start:11123 stop:12463 length:1341 start_codon:yes stop_codon:yes gene_type:complete
MNKIQLNKHWLNQIFIGLTFILALFPILTFGLRSIITIVWVLCGILNTFRLNTKTKKKKRDLIFLIVSILPFIYLCITLFYSENFNLGQRRIVQMLPFFLFPIIFYLNKDQFRAKQLQNICWFFSVSVIILVLYQILYSLFRLDFLMAELSNEEIVRNLLSEKKLLNEDVVSEVKIRRFRSFLLDITDTHFTYQGLWIIFSIFFLSKLGFQKFKLKKYKGLLLFSISLILMVWLFLISSRMPIIAMVIAAFYVMFVLGRITIKYQLLLLLVTLLFLNISYFVFTPFRVRANEIFKTKFEFPTESRGSYSYSSVNVRNGIYFCVSRIAKEHIMFGVGVGDSQDELNKCYNDKIGAKIYTWKDYNTHNQYFFFLVASGLIGAVLFLALLYLHWKTATNRSNPTYLYFITIIGLISLTENILSRSDGVMFFAFFSGLFLFNINELNDNN